MPGPIGGEVTLAAGIFLIAFIDSLVFGIVIFSGSALFALSTAALVRGQISIIDIWVSALAGSFAGDQLSFFLGRATGGLSHHWIGRRALANAVAKGEYWIAKYGPAALIPGRFVAATRKVIPLVLGTSPIRYGMFACLDGIACLLWVSFWSFVLYYSVVKGMDILHALSGLRLRW